jgi:glycine cleavage system aminomethyltransferase T
VQDPTDKALRAALAEAGAVIDAEGRVRHFGNEQAELRALFRECALVDQSGLGRLLGRGEDLLGLLHRLSTGAVRQIVPGAGAQTVLTSPKGRIVERLFLHHLGHAGLLLVGSPGCWWAVQAAPSGSRRTSTGTPSPNDSICAT